LTAIGSHYVAFLSISVSLLMNAVAWCVCVCTTSVGLKKCRRCLCEDVYVTFFPKNVHVIWETNKTNNKNFRENL
jgi:hypothetical protein